MTITPFPNRKEITALVLTHNCIDTIERCLNSVAWCDEILVVDSGSDDGTRVVVNKFATRVLEHPYENYIEQNNWAIPQAKHEWVLSVDSDEVVTPELRDEILRLLEDGPDCNSYTMDRENYFMGHPVPHCLSGDTERRLFLREKAHFPAQRVHANPEVEGPSRHLKGKLLHFSFRSFSQYMPKLDQLADRAAHDRAQRINKVGAFHLLCRPFGRFIRQYILKGGFLDGRPGLVFCLLSSFSSFLKYARLWEIIENKKKAGTAQ